VVTLPLDGLSQLLDQFAELSRMKRTLGSSPAMFGSA
jgi:hypothetical protein